MDSLNEWRSIDRLSMLFLLTDVIIAETSALAYSIFLRDSIWMYLKSNKNFSDFSLSFDTFWRESSKTNNWKHKIKLSRLATLLIDHQFDSSINRLGFIADSSNPYVSISNALSMQYWTWYIFGSIQETSKLKCNYFGQMATLHLLFI